MLTPLRIVAAGLALALMGGELWRSWGVDRPLAFVVDDFVFGVPLLIAAIGMGRPDPRRRAFFAAAWAGNVGMLYGSFFDKIVDPGAIDAGNWGAGILTLLIGLAFVTAIAGLLLTLFLRTE